MQKLKMWPIYTERGCDYHRIQLPSIFSRPWFDRELYNGYTLDRLDEFLSFTEIVCLNRNFPLGPNALLEKRDTYGFKIVCDLDDWLQLPEYHQLYKSYRGTTGEMIKEQLRRADLVTVTNERLKDKVLQHHLNDNVVVIPNALPYGTIQFTEQPERPENELFTFVYAGQASHLEDVRLLIPALGKVKYEKNMSVAMAGYVKNPVPGRLDPPITVAMEKVFQLGPNYRRILNRKLFDYMPLYDGADCSLIPLCLNDFNSCKSNLKLLEAGCKKIPAIVSWVPPYRDELDPPPVLWAQKAEDWAKHMRLLANDRPFARMMGNALYEWAYRNYNLYDWNAVRYEHYANILGRSFK